MGLSGMGRARGDVMPGDETDESTTRDNHRTGQTRELILGFRSHYARLLLTRSQRWNHLHAGTET